MKVLIFAIAVLFASLPAFGSGKRTSHPSPQSPGGSAVIRAQEAPGVASPLASLDTAHIPVPIGLYVLDDPSDERPASGVYATGLTASPAYQNDIEGHAIFVPIAKILPSITTWGQFSWNWTYLDSLVTIAVTHGKMFSIELETGFQSGSTYLQALPAGFRTLAGDSSAPLFDVWVTGGSGGRGMSAYIPLPWNNKIQEFWSAAANALAAHLQQTGVYGSLTLVHIPGLSVYDEELRLPTGLPAPVSTDTSHCPDGRLATIAVAADADTGRWRTLGYSDTALVNGFGVIASAFAQAFPDRYLGLSLFPHGGKGIDFPNLTHDSVSQVAWQIVKKMNAIAAGRVQLQADNLDGNFVESEVLAFANASGDRIGWQSNKHGGTGAGCDGGGANSCDPDGPSSLYFQLLRNGWLTNGKYLEVWSKDVVSYPQSFAGASASGYYTLTDVRDPEASAPVFFDLKQNYPNPFNPSTTIHYVLRSRSHVILSVYTALGQKVTELVNAEKEAGGYDITFNANGLASGVYLYRIQAGSFVETKKLVLLR